MFKEIQNYNYKKTVDFDFNALADLIATMQYKQAVEKIKTLIAVIDLDNLPFEKNSYTRSLIIDNEKYWLGLLNWDKGAATRIHGHPDHAFVYVLKGHLSCKNFDKNQLTELGGSELSAEECRYNKGVEGKMDNYIHQINATEKSVSLHFYSDNPSKGEVFDL
ncbi:Cysteine dioxygenase type I [uncultured Candidatus Thioglobus sp.]|nr:Cysteine dioxygenase type I [uncultured Candidatus Thioglobus sp.]